MAFYTPDGIRHDTQEEALEYMKGLLTETPPSEDEEVQAIHKHDWGNFSVQCAPSEDGTFYLELSENTSSTHGDIGYSLLTYSSNTKSKDISERIEDIEKAKRLVSMVGYEIKNLLDDLADDTRYFYDETTHDVVVHYDCNEGFSAYDSIRYVIDGVFEDYVLVEEGEDILQKVLKSVESQFINIVEGELSPLNNTDTTAINGYNLDLILTNAETYARNIKIVISDRTEEA